MHPVRPPRRRRRRRRDLKESSARSIEQALQHARFNKSKAAKALGIDACAALRADEALRARVMVIADFVPAVRAIVDVESFGVVLRRPDPNAQLLTRHRAGTAGHLIPLEHIPGLLTPFIDAAALVTPLREHAEAAHPMIVRILESGAESLLLMPLPGPLGLFWAGRPSLAPLSDQQWSDLTDLAARLAAAVGEPEPRDIRLSRLARIDKVEQILPVVAEALDVRDVFHRLSEVARSVLPHDAATIQLLDLDQGLTPGCTGALNLRARRASRANMSRKLRGQYTPTCSTSIFSSRSTTICSPTPPSATGRPRKPACARRCGCRSPSTAASAARGVLFVERRRPTRRPMSTWRAGSPTTSRWRWRTSGWPNRRAVPRRWRHGPTIC